MLVGSGLSQKQLMSNELASGPVSQKLKSSELSAAENYEQLLQMLLRVENETDIELVLRQIPSEDDQKLILLRAIKRCVDAFSNEAVWVDNLVAYYVEKFGPEVVLSDLKRSNLPNP